MMTFVGVYEVRKKDVGYEEFGYRLIIGTIFRTVPVMHLRTQNIGNRVFS